MALSVSTPQSQGGLAGFVYGFLRRIPAWALWLVVVIWTIPSFSLFVNGFRARSDQRNNGFWTQLTDAVGITDINESSWTLGNYRNVFDADSTASLVDSLGNSFAVSIPATIIPIPSTNPRGRPSTTSVAARSENWAEVMRATTKEMMAKTSR